MQDVTGATAEEAGDRDHTFRSVVADLICLVERIQASLELVEQAIIIETSAGKEDSAADVIVLDDVTPGFVRASTALQACEASLGLAVHLLQEPLTEVGAPLGDVREERSTARV